MKQLFTLISLFFISFFWVEAQELYTIQGVVCDSDKEPLSFVSVRDCHTDSLYSVNDSGQFVIKTDTLPIKLVFKSAGYVDKKVTVTKENYKDLSLVTLNEEVILKNFDKRGAIRKSEEEHEKWGQYEGVLVGKVIDNESKSPVMGAQVVIRDKNNQIEWGTIVSIKGGYFYLPIKYFPSHIEVSFVGCKVIHFKVTKKNVNRIHLFRLELRDDLGYCVS